jgi:predicted RNase H-like HicB family nuclease
MTEDEALDGIREAIELYLQPDPTELAAGTITREITV